MQLIQEMVLLKRFMLIGVVKPQVAVTSLTMTLELFGRIVKSISTKLIYWIKLRLPNLIMLKHLRINIT